MGGQKRNRILSAGFCVLMSNLIKKVFSPKLAKSYYITRTQNGLVNGIPCFSLEELDFIKQSNISVEELEYIYAAKLKDPLFNCCPKEDVLPVGTVITKEDSMDEGTKAAMRECVDFVLKRGSNDVERGEAAIPGKVKET